MRGRGRRWVAMLAAVAVLAAACGDDDDDDAGDDTPAGTATEDTDAPDGAADATTVPDATDGTGASTPATEPEGEIDPTARFRWANGVGLTRFDPHRASSSNDNTHLFLTYDRLIHQDSSGAAVPGLAESWSFEEDGRVLELHLRDGVVFHDGTPFDAEAVKANIERAKTVEGSAVVSELSSITEVEVVDPLTVRLHLTAPNAALPLILSDRAGAMISPAAFDNPDLDLQPVGAGMFQVTAYDPGSSITYDAFPDYWDEDAVRVAGIDMTIQTDSNTRVNALVSGQIDATVLPPRLVEDVERAGLNVVIGRTNNFWYFQPNRTRSEFGDKRVRQALWHAINRQALVDALALGYGTLSAQPVPEWSFAHDPTIDPDHYPYDPERARELLAEAGLEDGFSFEAMVSTSPEVQMHAEAIQSDLAAVGIDMQMRILEGDQITDLFFVRGEGDLLMGPGGGRPDPAQTTGLRYTPGGFMNPGDHTTPEIQALQERVITTVDPEARTEAFHELFRAVLDEAMEVILYYASPPLGMSPRVVGFDPLLADRPEFRGVAILAE
jgi:peptide/nickel transport system substrate-binding protein